MISDGYIFYLFFEELGIDDKQSFHLLCFFWKMGEKDKENDKPKKLFERFSCQIGSIYDGLVEAT
jgi:hypothetical protein